MLPEDAQFAAELGGIAIEVVPPVGMASHRSQHVAFA
jgi:hypothetical protein